MSKPIYDITPFTLIDYPDKTACIIWFAGCNMRCPYCYNPEIVNGKGRIKYFDALEFIISRKNLLDGVVLSGGECSLHPEIHIFAAAVKKLGMLVKIDTNGSNPQMIRTLIKNGSVDYVALDFKAPQSKYREVTGCREFNNFNETLNILLAENIAFEVRTTVHQALLGSDDIRTMIVFLEEKGYGGVYYLQNFINHSDTIGNLSHSDPVDMSAIESKKIRISVRNQR